MLNVITLIIVIILLLIAGTLHRASEAFYELHGAFKLVMIIILLFIIGSAVYLSYAIPSLADPSHSSFQQQQELQVTQDSATGIIFEE